MWFRLLLWKRSWKPLGPTVKIMHKLFLFSFSSWSVVVSILLIQKLLQKNKMQQQFFGMCSKYMYVHKKPGIVYQTLFLFFTLKYFYDQGKLLLCFYCRVKFKYIWSCLYADFLKIRMVAYVYFKKNQFCIHCMHRTVGFQHAGIPRRTRENNKPQNDTATVAAKNRRRKKKCTECLCMCDLSYRRLKITLPFWKEKKLMFTWTDFCVLSMWKQWGLSCLQSSLHF